MPESGSSGHLLVFLKWASLASGSFRSQLFRDHVKSGSSTEDDISVQLGDEPRPGAVSRGLYFCLSLSGDQHHPTSVALPYPRSVH